MKDHDISAQPGSRARRYSRVAGAIATLALQIGTSAAQQAAEPLEEITVTATRREQSISQVPLSITALSDVALAQRGVIGFKDYAPSVPNVAFGYAGDWADHEKNIQVSTEKLVQALTRHPPPALRWAHRYYRGDDHMSTPHRALYDALELLFAGWRMPLQEGSQMPSLREVEAHYAALSQRFGFSVVPTAAALEGVAQGLLEQGKNDEALEVLRRSTREHHYLAATYSALGQALEKLGRGEEALRAYEEGLRVALEDDSPYGNSVGEDRGDPVGAYRAKVKELGRTQ